MKRGLRRSLPKRASGPGIITAAFIPVLPERVFYSIFIKQAGRVGVAF